MTTTASAAALATIELVKIWALDFEQGDTEKL